jgi:hypothetical protein
LRATKTQKGCKGHFEGPFACAKLLGHGIDLDGGPDKNGDGREKVNEWKNFDSQKNLDHRPLRPHGQTGKEELIGGNFVIDKNSIWVARMCEYLFYLLAIIRMTALAMK